MTRFFPISDRQLQLWESAELVALKVYSHIFVSLQPLLSRYHHHCIIATTINLHAHGFAMFLASRTVFQDLWSNRQQSKFWGALSKISREIDSVQTAIGKANDSHNKHFTMRVQSLCALCLQLAFISISSHEYSLSLRLIDTAQRLSVGCPLSSRLFAWMITIKSRALNALSRAQDAAAELSALARHKRLEADPFLRCCVHQLLSAALMCDSHFIPALQAAKDAVQYAAQAKEPQICVQLYKKLTSNVCPTLHDIDCAALRAFAAHNAAIASFLSGNLPAAEQFSRDSVAAGSESSCVPRKSLNCFRTTCNSLANAGAGD
jgi:hypothetical protein